MKRLLDYKECQRVTSLQREYFTFDEETWLANQKNYALIEEDNIAFAEYKKEGVYEMHLCFNSARGKAALLLVEKMLQKFATERDVSVMVGLIHKDNRKTNALVRRLGFTSAGLVETSNGSCELFYKGLKNGL